MQLIGNIFNVLRAMVMDDADYRNVPLDSILLDQSNYRFEGYTAESQREAIERLFETEGDKLYSMIQHMLKHGKHPGDLPILFPADKEGGDPEKFIAAEGNRRVLSAKAIRNPAIVPEKYKSKISKAVENSERDIRTKMFCAILEERKPADPWVELNHNGESGGAGRTPWTTGAKRAFEERVGRKPTHGRKIREFVMQHSNVDDSVKEKLKNIDHTSFDRFFGFKNVKDHLKIKADKGRLIITADMEEWLVALSEMIDYMSDPNFTVGDIFNKKKVGELLDGERFSSVKPQKNVKPWDLEVVKPSIENGVSKPYSAGAPIKVEEKGAKSAPQLSERKYVINFTLNIDNARVNGIYNELRRVISVHEAPNSCGVLMRVFLELSCDCFNERSPIQGYSAKSTKLKEKVEMVAKRLSAQRKISEDIKESIQRNVSNPNHFSSIEAFHKLVHSDIAQPLVVDLNHTMDNWRPFLEAIWAKK